MKRLLVVAALIALAAPAALRADEFSDAKKQFESAFSPKRTAEDRRQAVLQIAIYDTKDAVKLLLEGVEVVDEIVEPLVREKVDIDGRIEKALADQMFEQQRTLEEELSRKVKRWRRESAALQDRIDDENRVLIDIEYALGGLRSDEVVEYMNKTALFREKHWKARLLVANALGEIGDDSSKEYLVRALREKDERVLVAVIRAVGRVQAKDGLEDLIDLLDEKRWAVRSAAIESLGDLAEKAAVAPLIEQIEEEEGRLRHDCAEALTRLTGQKFGDSPELWRRWWEEHKHEYGVEEGQEPVGGHPADGGSGDPGRGYYGLPVNTSNAIFILDVSGSMSKSTTNPGEDPGQGELSKVEVAKKELSRVVKNFRSKGTFNLIVFNDVVKKWKPGMVPATRANKAGAMAWIKGLEAASSTNIYDALQTAFEVTGMGARDRHYDLAADTIFLLSDGSPTKPSGELDDWEKIIRAVDEWNRLKRIKIHTIGVGGHNAAFMSQLAAKNGGNYVAR